MQRTGFHIHFDVMFHGSDWKGSAMYNEVEQRLSSVGCDIVYLPHTDGISSTLYFLLTPVVGSKITAPFISFFNKPVKRAATYTPFVCARTSVFGSFSIISGDPTNPLLHDSSPHCPLRL